jgi:LacI family transcriptional regulator
LTRKKVLDAARTLGYQPNAAAAAFNSGSFGCVALLTGTDVTRSLMPPMTLRAIDSALAEHNLHLTMAQVPDEQLSDARFVPKILKSWMADGLLINYNAHIPDMMRRLIAENRLPSMWLNSDQPADCVRPDDVSAGRLATQTLLDLGHRRIAFLQPGFERRAGRVTPRRCHYSIADRIAGYEAAMIDAGLTPNVDTLEVERDTVEHLVQIGEILVRRRDSDAPTAYVIHNQQVVNAFAFVAAQTGCHIPADLSLITFRNEFLPGGSLPADAVQLPDADIGQRAVDCLVEKIQCGCAPLKPQLLPVKYVPGLTCRAPKPS